MTKFVEGRGTYIGDMTPPGTLHLMIVRSPHARARLLSVKGGIGAGELGATLAVVGEGERIGSGALDMPVLAKEYVSYVGQPVAAVVGPDPYAAEDLADSVEVEYDPMSPVVDPAKALSSEPIHPGMTSNVMSHVELGSDFDEDAPIVVEEEFANGRVAPNPIETRGVLANYDGARLTIWASTQSVHTFKQGLCQSLALAPGQVRVVQADTGGAFGTKASLYPEYVIAAYASMKLRRPVKWLETRFEHLRATSHGRGVSAKMKVFAEASGVVRGLKAELLIDGGAYITTLNAYAARFIGSQLTGPYSIPNAHVIARSVYTNKVPLGPYRGAGRPEAAFFVERMMDILADKLGKDPVEVRLANAGTRSFESPLGLKLPPFRPFLDTAIQRLGYGRKRSARAVGFSCFVLVPAAKPGEGARMAVREGRVKVWTGATSQGQGHEAFVRSLTSKELGIPESIITLERGDTDALREGIGTWGSRGALVGGAAIVKAAKDLKEAVARGRGGVYSPEALLESALEVEVFYVPEDQPKSFGATLVSIRSKGPRSMVITECSGCFDVGNALNPWMVHGQVAGGLAQGVGQVLYEGIEYNDEGQLLTSSVLDAGVPSAVEVPHFSIRLADASAGESGAKGLGESPTIGVPPALVRAVEEAIGKRVTKTPLPRELGLDFMDPAEREIRS